METVDYQMFHMVRVKLMTTSHEGGPLTIIQLQKNVWGETCEKKKSEVIQSFEIIGSSKLIAYKMDTERNNSFFPADVSFQNIFLRSLRKSVRGWNTVQNQKGKQAAKQKKRRE